MCSSDLTNLAENVAVKITASGLTQILQNLLVNAVHYSKQDPIITITTTISSRSAVVTVADNGIGIPAQDLPHIFDRFYRADHARKRIDGSGLGLSIVRMLVDKYQADISVTSGEAGTVFTLTLPRCL